MPRRRVDQLTVDKVKEVAEETIDFAASTGRVTVSSSSDHFHPHTDFVVLVALGAKADLVNRLAHEVEVLANKAKP